MHFYWVRDCLKQVHFNIFWKPGKDNLADYFQKHHPISYNRVICPIYILPCIIYTLIEYIEGVLIVLGKTPGKR